MFGELIIMIVYLPILTLTGIEGKMFHPMAFTVIARAARRDGAVGDVRAGRGGVVLTGRISEKENFVRLAERAYEPLLSSLRSRRHRRSPSSLGVAAARDRRGRTRLGSEFAPKLDEGDLRCTPCGSRARA
jgi:cobalt-zinc-cadmium resistance protein CzcA